MKYNIIIEAKHPYRDIDKTPSEFFDAPRRMVIGDKIIYNNGWYEVDEISCDETSLYLKELNTKDMMEQIARALRISRNYF